MSYCSNADVLAVCDTDVTPAEIDDLILESSAWMNMKLDTATIPALVLQMICRTHVAVRCYLKDGDETSLGEYSESRVKSLAKLNAMLDEMLKDVAGAGLRYSYEALPTGYVS